MSEWIYYTPSVVLCLKNKNYEHFITLDTEKTNLVLYVLCLCIQQYIYYNKIITCKLQEVFYDIEFIF